MYLWDMVTLYANEEFIEEYPYYSTWIEKNKATFKDGTRVVYELKDNEKTVGYMMVHFSTAKCAKVNGIYVFQDCQKRGYAIRQGVK